MSSHSRYLTHRVLLLLLLLLLQYVYAYYSTFSRASVLLRMPWVPRCQMDGCWPLDPRPHPSPFPDALSIGVREGQGQRLAGKGDEPHRRCGGMHACTLSRHTLFYSTVTAGGYGRIAASPPPITPITHTPLPIPLPTIPLSEGLKQTPWTRA